MDGHSRMGDHTECVRVTYNPEKTKYQDILDAFWQSHDSTVKTSRSEEHKGNSKFWSVRFKLQLSSLSLFVVFVFFTACLLCFSSSSLFFFFAVCLLHCLSSMLFIFFPRCLLRCSSYSLFVFFAVRLLHCFSSWPFVFFIACLLCSSSSLPFFFIPVRLLCHMIVDVVPFSLIDDILGRIWSCNPNLIELLSDQFFLYSSVMLRVPCIHAM